MIWTCHVGADTPNDITRSAWDFLRPSLAGASAVTFSRAAHVWEGLEGTGVALIPPCIDPLSLKNVELEVSQRDAILHAARVAEPSARGEPSFVRSDGAPGRVTHRADVFEEAAVPAGAPLVVQVSRWDRLKDPLGVLHGFAQTEGLDEAHLVLAGPLAALGGRRSGGRAGAHRGARRVGRARTGVRKRVHLASLPTEDVEENAVIVNALQRRADVVVQKSLAEGFGLTVTEAMWKARPVVAGRVGGIQDQIDDGTNGVLIDPRDPFSFGGGGRLAASRPGTRVSTEHGRARTGAGAVPATPVPRGLPGADRAPAPLVLLDHVPRVVHPEVGHPGVDAIARDHHLVALEVAELARAGRAPTRATPPASRPACSA